MAPKRNAQDYMFKQQEGQLLMKLPGQLQGAGFRLDRLTGCEVYLLDWTSQVMVDDCVDCRIFIGPCSGSVFVRDCTRCTLCAASRQLRTRDCTNLDCSLYCSTNPSIETSVGVRICAWRGAYPLASTHFAAAKLDPTANTWDQVYDFNAGEEVQGQVKHWCLEHGPRPLWVPPMQVEGHTLLTGQPEQPVAGDGSSQVEGQEAVGKLPCPQLEQLLAAAATAVAAGGGGGGPSTQQAAAAASSTSTPAVNNGPAAATAAAAGSSGTSTAGASGITPGAVPAPSIAAVVEAAAAPLVGSTQPMPATPLYGYDMAIDLDEEVEEEGHPRQAVSQALAQHAGADNSSDEQQQQQQPPAVPTTALAAAASSRTTSHAGGKAGGGVAQGPAAAGAAASTGAAAAAPQRAAPDEDARQVWLRANEARLAQAHALEAAAKQAAHEAAQATLRIQALARQARIAAQHQRGHPAATTAACEGQQEEVVWGTQHPVGWQGVGDLISTRAPPTATTPTAAAAAQSPPAGQLQTWVAGAAADAGGSAAVRSSVAAGAVSAAPPAGHSVVHTDKGRMREVLLRLRDQAPTTTSSACDGVKH